MNVLKHISQETRNNLKVNHLRPSNNDLPFTDEEIDNAFLEHETYFDEIIERAKNSEYYFRYRGSWDVIDDKHSELMNMVWIPYLDTIVSRKLLIKYNYQYYYPTKLTNLITHVNSEIQRLQKAVEELKVLEAENIG